MSSGGGWPLTDDEIEAGVGDLIYGRKNYWEWEDDETQQYEVITKENGSKDSNNSASFIKSPVDVALAYLESEFYGLIRKRHQAIDDKVAFAFQFLLRYFKPVALSRFIQENRLSQDSKILAFNSKCYRIAYTDYMLSYTSYSLSTSDLFQLENIVNETKKLTAYYRVQAVRDFVIDQIQVETKIQKKAFGKFLGTLRLHFLLSELDQFKYYNKSGIENFKSYYCKHKTELDAEWKLSSARNRLKYFHLQSLLYFYPRFVREFYTRYFICIPPAELLSSSRCAIDTDGFKEITESIMEDARQFYEIYYKNFTKNVRTVWIPLILRKNYQLG